MDNMKMDDMGGMDMGNMDMGMMSYFHGGTKETLLFKVWKIGNWGTLILSCIIMIVLGILYESLKFFRRYVHARSMANMKGGGSQEPLYGTSQGPTQQTGLVDKTNSSQTDQMMYPTFSIIHISQTLLFGVQAYLSYCLMLVFMTFNVYLCTSVIIGLTVGYFVFGHRRPGFDTSLDDCCTT